MHPLGISLPTPQVETSRADAVCKSSREEQRVEGKREVLLLAGFITPAHKARDTIYIKLPHCFIISLLRATGTVHSYAVLTDPLDIKLTTPPIEHPVEFSKWKVCPRNIGRPINHWARVSVWRGLEGHQTIYIHIPIILTIHLQSSLHSVL